MSKTIGDAPITTRSSRLRLTPGTHWRSLDAEHHIGYRKGARAGRWLVRWRVEKTYRQESLASADDVLEADGIGTLSFEQATREAKHFIQDARKRAAAKAAGPIQTVTTAALNYADLIENRHRDAGRPVAKDCRSRFKNHVSTDPIAKIELYALTAADIRAWRKRARAKGLKPASLKRVANDFRAALNNAGQEFKRALPDRFPMEIRDGFVMTTSDRFIVATRANMILPDNDVRRLILSAREIDAEQGWDGGLARLVIALAATGARFSQLARCKVADLQVHTKRLLIPVSAKGRGLKSVSHVAAALGDDVIDELRSQIRGRRGHEVLLLRPAFRREGRGWERDGRRPWQAAEISKPFREIAKRAGLSGDASAYCLRHSSIARALRAGLPIRLVAAAHDTSSTMIELHYAAHVVDAMSDVARLAVVPLAAAAQVIKMIAQVNQADC